MHETSLAGAIAPRTRPWREDAQAAGLVGVAHLSAHVFQMLLPPIYPWLMHDFGIGFTEAGFLATVFFVVSASAQALAGFVVDRIGALRVLFLGLGLLVAAGTSLALCQSYAALVVTAALAGAGNGMFHPADFSILNRCVSPGRLGHAFAMHGLSGNLGWFIGTALMSGVTAVAGWHVAGASAAVFALAIAGLVWARGGSLRDTHEHAQAAVAGKARPASGQFAFLRSGTIWLCFGFFFLATGAGGILQNFAPSLLAHVYSVPLALGTMCLSAYLLGSAAGTVFGGFLAGREQRSERVVAAALSLAGMISLALASGEAPAWALLPALLVIGGCTGTAGPSRDLLVRRAASAHCGPSAFGRVYGFVYSGLDSGLAIAPLLVGRLLDHGFFHAGLLCVGCLQAAATMTALRFNRLR